MKIHYLEIVSNDIDGVCHSYEQLHGVKFSEPDPLLGGAKTCELADGTIVGVRSPMRETELPVVRPYWLTDDIEKAVTELVQVGAVIAMPPMELPGKGQFAIYIQGGNEQGLWQL